MCEYTGYEFGACYPDSVCIDGFLWDADSSEDDGLLTQGGELPCPACNVIVMLKRAYDDAKEGSCGKSMLTPWCAAVVWEAAIAGARKANPQAAEAYLAMLGPFYIEDWPDREAVYAGRASWENTMSVEWRYEHA